VKTDLLSHIGLERKNFFEKIGLKFKEKNKIMKFYIWSIAVYSAETLTLRNIDIDIII
jgi:hypothetical protein